MAESKQAKIITQESKHDNLLQEEDQFPDEIVGECQWPLELGPRKGQACGKKTFDGKDLCSTHQVQEARRKEKEEKQKGKVFSSIERSDVPLISLQQSPPKTQQLPQYQPQFQAPPPQPQQFQHYQPPQQYQPPQHYNNRRRRHRRQPESDDEEEESLLTFSEMLRLLQLFSTTMTQLSQNRNDNNYE